MRKFITYVLLAALICVSSAFPSDAFAVCRWTDLSKEVITTEQRMLDWIDGSVVFLSGLSSIYAEGERIEMKNGNEPLEIFEENGIMYIPSSYAAQVFGGKYEYYQPSDTEYIRFTNFTLHFVPGSDKYYVNDTMYEMKGASIVKNNVCYLASDILRKTLDMYFYKCTNGMLIASPAPFKLDDTNFNTQANLEAVAAKKICLVNLGIEQVKKDFYEHTPNSQHPRVIINTERKAKLLEWCKTDADFIRWKENAITAADAALKNKLPEYTPDERGTIISVGRDAKSSLMNMAMAYMLTSEQKYIDGAWPILEAVGNFPDWHPEHFLDVGEMCAGVALAYDWMYDGFTNEQREFIREAIKKHALTPAMDAYTDKSSPANRYDWTHSGTNWNAVGNGGITMAALAIAGDDSSEIAFQAVTNSISSIGYMMKSFAPEGAWFEGVQYWGYTMEFFGFQLASLFSALGTDYGLTKSPGVSKTAYYPVNLTRPNGKVYRFSDDGQTGAGRTNEYPLLAWIFNDTALQKLVKNDIKNGGGGLGSLMYYHPEIQETESFFELDNKYSGLAEIVTMRGSFSDSNALFVGARAGTTSINHGHFDIGSFVFDADGVEWFKDGGGGDYTWTASRYLYYRHRAESHNMVVVNPSDDYELDESSVTPIEFKSAQRGAIATLDMTNTYAKNKDVVSAKRAMALINDRTSFLVQDEIKTNDDGYFVWFAHTATNVTLSEDGKTAVLDSNGKKLHVQILSPANASFTAGPDEPLPTSPQLEEQTASFKKDTTKLSIHVRNTNDVTFSVLMTPLRDGVNIEDKIPEVTPIDTWTIPEGEIPTVDTISVSGELMNAYDKYSDSYTLLFDEAMAEAPVIEATSDDYNINVIQAASVPGTAIIQMLKDGEVVRNYYVDLKLDNQLGIIEGKKKHKVISVYASAVPEPHNPPANLVDNNIDTKWAAMLDQWVIHDLGEEKIVDTFGIGWHDPTKRISPFEIEVSNDLENWTTVYSGKSSGKKVPIETYSFNPVNARYVRLNVHGWGTPPSGWNSIMETCIYGPAQQEE